MRQALQGPPCPAAAKHLWAWWSELNNGRIWSDYASPQPIRAADIREWAELTGRRVGPMEARLLLDLDARFRIVVSRDEADPGPLTEDVEALLEWGKSARLAAGMAAP